MANDNTDNLNISIKAIVQGLADVRLLVKEIEKLPGAGDGLKGLSGQFNGIKTAITDTIREIDKAGNELKTLGTDTSRIMQQAAASTQQVPGNLNKVTTSANATRTSLGSLTTTTNSLVRALGQALRGDVLGAIHSVGTALQSSLNITAASTKAVGEIKQISKAANDTEKVLSKFSSVLGTAAKNPGGAVAGALSKDFGINAQQGLLNTELALQKYIATLSAVESAEERAAEVANIFGASTAQLLPTIEKMVAEYLELTAATDKVALAQVEATTATEAATAADLAATEAKLDLAAADRLYTSAALEAYTVNKSATATEAEQIAADEALIAAKQEFVAIQAEVAAATAAQTAALEAEIIATEALAVAEQELSVINVEVAATEAAVDVAGAPLIATLGAIALAIGGILLVAGGVILAGVAIGKSFADAGTKMQDLSEKTGITVESLSALKLAAGESRVEFSKVETALPRFAKNLNEAAGGNKALAATFKQMGVDAKAGAKDVTGALDSFAKYADKLPDDGQKADAFIKAFGKSGADLIPIFNRVGGNMAAFREEVAKLGGMTSEQAANAAKFSDAYETLGFTLTNIKNQIGADLLPTLIDLANSLTQFIKDNKQGFSDLASVLAGVFNFCIGLFLAFGGTVAFLANLVYGLINAIAALVIEFYEMGTAAIQVGAAVAKFIGGDIAGAVLDIQNATSRATDSLKQLGDELKRTQTIISQPTFESFFKFLNGGDGSTSKTFGSKPAPTATFKGGGAPKKAKVDPEIKAYQEALLAYRKASIQAEADLLQDGLKHESDILKANFSQNLIDYQTYYDGLTNIELRANEVRINEQLKLLKLEQDRLATAKKGSERLKAETDILKINTELEKLYKNQKYIVALNSVEIAKQARTYNDMITDIKDQLLDLEQRTSESAADRIDKQFRDSLEKAQALAATTGDNSDVDRINNLKELLKAQARYNELLAGAKSYDEERSIKEDELNLKVQQGLLTRQKANDELASFEDGLTSHYTDLIAGLEKFANKVGDPALIQAVQKIKIGLQGWKVSDTARQVEETKTQIQQAQDSLDTYNQKIDNQLKDGAIKDSEAYDLREAKLATYKEQVNTLLDTLQAIATVTHNTDLQGYIDKTRTNLQGLKADSNAVASDLNTNFASTFVTLFQSIADGSKSAGSAFADFGRSILKTLSDLAVKVLLYKYLFPLLGIDIDNSGTGQSGGLGGIFGKLLGFGSGGHTGSGDTDEIAGIVHKREFVVKAPYAEDNLAVLQAMNSGLNPVRPLNAGNNVSGAATMAASIGAQNLQINNVLPNDLLDNYISNAPGTRTLLNFIEDNSTAINTRLKGANG
jgi:hypothetical protein